MNGSVFTPISYEQLVQEINAQEVGSSHDKKSRHVEPKGEDYEYCVYHQSISSLEHEIASVNISFLAFLNHTNLNQRLQVKEHV